MTPDTIALEEYYDQYSDPGPVRAHLAKIDAPDWVIPYQLTHTYEHGLSILAEAGRHTPRRLYLDETWHDALLLARRVGRAVLLGRTYAAGYVGVPLLAAHTAARAMLRTLTEDLECAGMPVALALEKYVMSLWPTPAAAFPPRDITLALTVDREAQQLGLYDNIPGLRELVRAGINTDRRRYAAATGHLLQYLVRHYTGVAGRPQAESLAPALAALIAEATPEPEEDSKG
ncbi:hypothetical protein [Bailinhaonella thermotolerans]|uniref:Uncharacterized protein n=1 Tax=Bailinhaonella thermotolerans TaxID=1070861 RepID=A0A3A4A2U0_9ACTN|nr:hypothetical protein [Bailinhaonella thermotolerans]RJL19404.1 hypothetical protein D5H75_40400 [Bailinhaonella thermotolerans]